MFKPMSVLFLLLFAVPAQAQVVDPGVPVLSPFDQAFAAIAKASTQNDDNLRRYNDAKVAIPVIGKRLANAMNILGNTPFTMGVAQMLNDAYTALKGTDAAMLNATITLDGANASLAMGDFDIALQRANTAFMLGQAVSCGLACSEAGIVLANMTLAGQGW